VEPLLSDLERRDAHVAGELARVEAEQAEVEQLRMHAAAAQAFLVDLPGRVASFVRAQRSAEDDAARARDMIHEAAEEDRARYEAELVAARARVERAREHVAALEAEGVARRAEAARLCARAGAADLDATLAWASHRRGALLVERSNLARERDAIVREASELLASVLGEPFALTSVHGLRDRLP
jgi:hypothetical protein